jgi:non-ribosomal peptide synthetase component F
LTYKETETNLYSFFSVSIDSETQSSDFASLLRRVRSLVLEGFDHPYVSIDQLIQTLQIPRRSEHMPLVQVMFTLVPPTVFSSSPSSGNSLEFVEDLTDMDTKRRVPVRYDLLLEACQPRSSTDSMRIRLQYRTDVLSSAKANRMARHFVDLLRDIVSRSSGPSLLELRLMSQEEEQSVLLRPNQTMRLHDHWNDHVIEAFERQVKRQPTHLAVEFQETKCTYSELQDRASVYVEKLSALGKKDASEQTFVLICMTRSIELIACLLAVRQLDLVYVSRRERQEERREYPRRGGKSRWG